MNARPRGPFALVPPGAFLALVEAEGAEPARLHLVWGQSGDMSHTLCGLPDLYIGEPNPDYAEVTAQCPRCAAVAAVLAGTAPGRALAPGELWADPRGDEFLVIRHGTEPWLTLARPVEGTDLTGWTLAAEAEGPAPMVIVATPHGTQAALPAGDVRALAGYVEQREAERGQMVTAVSYQYGEYGESEQFRVYTVPSEDYTPGMLEADAEVAAVRPFTWEDAPGYRGAEPIAANKDPQPGAEHPHGFGDYSDAKAPQ